MHRAMPDIYEGDLTTVIDSVWPTSRSCADIWTGVCADWQPRGMGNGIVEHVVSW